MDVKSKPPPFPYQTNFIDVPMGWEILESQSDKFNGTSLYYSKWTVWGYNNIYGEIDVYEVARDYDMSTSYKSNYHRDLGQSTQSSLLQPIELDDTFIGKENVFAVEWLPEELNFYLNGRIRSCY